MSERDAAAGGPGLPTLRYESIDRADVRRSDTIERADEVLRDGWTWENFGSLDIEGIDWDTAAKENRSWRFQLNSWTFMGQVLASYDQTGDRRYLDWASRAAVSWAAHFPAFVDDADAWYDMAVGLRGHRLGYLIDAQRSLAFPDPPTLTALLASAEEHFQAFATDSLFAAHSNHGLYFAVGQAALARRVSDLPAAAGHEEQAQQRLKVLIDKQFAADGIHREHSPAYHQMILESVNGVIEAGLVQVPEVQGRLELAAEALAWFVTPARTLVQFGDTALRSVAPGAAGRWSGTAMRHVSTLGEAGTAPTETSTAFRDGGYWIAKDKWWGSEDEARAGSYLALTAAFHSRVHKHADDLSLVWWHRGQEILVDAGRFGYIGRLARDDPARLEGFFYSAPERQFVESTRAHNTVQIDDLDFPRRMAAPYGSGIVSAHHVDGIHAVVAEATHFDTVIHTRVTATVPGTWLLVFDKVRTTNGDRRRFTQRFAFAPECDVFREGDALRIALPDSASVVRVISLDGSRLVEPMRGATSPLLGWTSREDRELVATTATGFERSDVSFATFVTLFTADEGVEAQHLRYGGPGGGDAVEITKGEVEWRLGLGPFGTEGAQPVTIARYERKPAQESGRAPNSR